MKSSVYNQTSHTLLNPGSIFDSGVTDLKIVNLLERTVYSKTNMFMDFKRFNTNTRFYVMKT